MIRRFAIGFGSAAFLVLLVSVVRADEKSNSAGAKSAHVQFEQLKRLVGEWTGKGQHGDVAHDANINFKLTSAGSTLMETVFAGTNHEMVTMYHVDGDALVLTHYCALGNQPRMKAVSSGDPKKVVFRFLDGTNLDAAKDVHMHDATIEFISDDHFRSEWTSYTNGKQDSVAKFEFKRKK